MATVSRVINGSTRVRPSTREKVTNAMKALGYTPSSIAQSLASKFSNSVGIQVSELRGPFYGPMMSGINEELHHANIQGLITSGHSDAEREKQGIESLMSRQCDALILHVEAVSDDYLIDLSKRSVPFVLLNRYIEELADQCIILDNLMGGYIATKQLVDMGHRDIAYITGLMWKTDSKERLQGHKNALADAGIPFNEDLYFEGDFMKESGSRGVEHFLKSKQHFTAVVCGNDEMAAGALSTVREADMQIPQEVSIMGFDDINLANYLYPSLTTIRYPVEEMAAMAAKWVLKHVYKQDVAVKNKFLPELVLRDSCSIRKLH